MGKLRVFEIVFDNDNDLYRAGDWVQGHVKIELSEKKTEIRGIEIKYKAKAKTKWTEEETQGEGDDEERVEVDYYLKEKYFEEKMLILGKNKKDKSGAKVHLDAGEHIFPFQFQLPAKPLPHAFEGRFGRIRYKVRAKIDRPGKHDHTVEKMFSVVGVPIDLNNKPEASMPSKSEDEKTVCCLCCATGPIRAEAQTNKSGYVPGETIWVTGMVENNSTREISSITAKLIQKLEFKAEREGHGSLHHKVLYITLGEARGEGCGENETASFEQKSIPVPSCPPSDLEGCGIMDIEYYVEFEADVSGTPFDLELKLPITIGTVPLFSAYSAAFPPGDVVTQQPTAPHLPPAAYEVAMGGPQEIPSKSGYDYTFGKMMYAPKYPYYTFPNAGGDLAYPPAADSAYPPPANPAYPPPANPAYPPPANPAYPPPAQ
ncbi:arrestin domain-containing protein 3-like [Amphiura filiformis]|uniref:arrestin domain-containing protein 3-like n=1 Tax=Amphiura filiformis TaxID=82378 RepID=UPI003B21A45D